jgi:hypothetical protein
MKTYAVIHSNDVLMKIKAHDLDSAWQNFSEIKQLEIYDLKLCKYNIEEDIRV